MEQNKGKNKQTLKAFFPLVYNCVRMLKTMDYISFNEEFYNQLNVIYSVSLRFSEPKTNPLQ